MALSSHEMALGAVCRLLVPFGQSAFLMLTGRFQWTDNLGFSRRHNMRVGYTSHQNE